MITKEIVNGEEVFAVDSSRRDEMTIEMSPSYRYTISKPSPHITLRRLRMITKESIDGEDFFAIDEPLNQGCNKCMFETIPCGHIRCTSTRRDDGRNVHFRPAYELKTLAAYHAQKHSDVQ